MARDGVPCEEEGDFGPSVVQRYSLGREPHKLAASINTLATCGSLVRSCPKIGHQRGRSQCRRSASFRLMQRSKQCPEGLLVDHLVAKREQFIWKVQTASRGR